MKKLILHTLKALGGSAILGVSILSAQVKHTIVANVPFDFRVLDQHLSAGTYTLTSESPQGAILIRGQQGATATFFLAFSTQASKVQNDGKLVFNTYGDQYFLNKIWYPGTDQGRELRVSMLEQEIARNRPKSGET